MVLVRQRASRDCAIGALAMLAARQYEDVYDAATVVEGLSNTDVIQLARRLRIRLQPTRAYDLDVDEGILRVRFSGSRGRAVPGGHFVTVRGGIIYCPADASSATWQDYMLTWAARGCTLLKEVA